MSFLGAVGDMVSGSGIEELPELVCATNSVGNMMSGKAFTRAIRGHFLVILFFLGQLPPLFSKIPSFLQTQDVPTFYRPFINKSTE